MRVCIVTIAGYVHGIGGMQRHTSDLARGLAAAGHEVEVITTRHPEGLAQAEHDGALWHFADSEGNQVSRDWHRASVATFEAAHRERPFDVIHSESTCALGLVRAGIPKRVPLAVKYHGNFVGLARANARRAVRARRPYVVAKEGRAFLWLCARHFPRGNWWRFHAFESMVPSRQQLTGTSISHLVPRSRLHVVPNAVDTERFAPRDRAATRGQLGLGPEPLVVAAGRLDRDKALHTAVAALARLEPPARLAVVGDGPDRGRLAALAGELGVAERVDFVGARTVDDVAAFLAAADAFVFPTERDEGAPMILIEAMAAAAPVVASSMGQIAEVVDRPGENGLLVTPGDVDAFARALGTLVADPARATGIGSAGRTRILGDYTLDRMIERTLAVYELALARLR